MKDIFQRIKPLTILTGCCFLLATLLLGYQATQSDFMTIAIGYSVMFAIYGLWLYQKKRFYWKHLLFFAILARVVVVFALPSLSDDFYRFVWDGLLTNAGYNPFNFLPQQIVEEGMNIPHLNLEIYESMNSPRYYTVYPAVLQAIFAISTFVFGDNVYAATIMMKSIVCAMEIGSIGLIIGLLKHFNQPLDKVIWYAANPLVIIEITGNLHFEGVAIFFFVLAWWLMVKDKFYLSAIAMALSIAAKLLPLMFMPFLIKRLGWKRAIVYFVVIGIVLLLAFSPLLNEVFISNFRNSLELYFAHFEYNASVFYILQWIGRQLSNGHNWIDVLGPTLGLWTALTIFGKAWWEKSPNWENFGGVALFAFSLFLLTTTTVHPWYLSFLILLAPFAHFRFPLVWSFFAVLTYINYSYNPYHENKWIVALEYAVVAIVIVAEVIPFLQNRKAIDIENTLD